MIKGIIVFVVSVIAIFLIIVGLVVVVIFAREIVSQFSQINIGNEIRNILKCKVKNMLGGEC